MSAPRKIIKLAATRRFSVPVAAGVTILQSALVILDDGFARPARVGQGGDTAAQAADALTHVCVGVALEGVTGGAANGDVSVEVERDCFGFVNSSAGDLITRADIGKSAFIVDDQTVAKTSASSTRARAGVIEDVTPEAVWVSIGKANFA
ncbi:hypothetical protein GVN24_24735 [Rhizobium sp. CRIBSB]|nr:hypothetical protein [Rhizobium sp. CRIBSB]